MRCGRFTLYIFRFTGQKHVFYGETLFFATGNDTNYETYDAATPTAVRTAVPSGAGFGGNAQIRQHNRKNHRPDGAGAGHRSRHRMQSGRQHEKTLYHVGQGRRFHFPETRLRLLRRYDHLPGTYVPHFAGRGRKTEDRPRHDYDDARHSTNGRNRRQRTDHAHDAKRRHAGVQCGSFQSDSGRVDRKTAGKNAGHQSGRRQRRSAGRTG